MEDDNVHDEMVGTVKQEVDKNDDGSMADASSETDNDIGDADMVDNEGRVARTGPDGEIEADLGDTIRNYVILRELGSGTFAKVFAVEDSANPAAGELALKVVRAHLDYSTPSRREAAMLRRLNTHHPQKARFIVPLLREFDFSQHHCMLFPVFGCDVVAFMDRNGGRGFPVDQVRRMAFDVLSGLEYLHSLGIVHTDMKPENVLFRNDRCRTERRDDGEEVYLLDEASVVICDLNSAVNTAVDTMPAGTIQTLNYRAPEVIFDLERGCPMDVWSTACLLYEVMWGTIMFDSVDDDNTMPSRLRHLALIHRTLAERSMDPYCESLTVLPRHLTTVFLDVMVELEMEDLGDSRKPWQQLDGVEKRNFDALLRSMLLVDPDVRATAVDALKSRFLEQLS